VLTEGDNYNILIAAEIITARRSTLEGASMLRRTRANVIMLCTKAKSTRSTATDTFLDHCRAHIYTKIMSIVFGK
jgi:hypothetical protein